MAFACVQVPFARAQIIVVDQIVQNLPSRLLRRSARELPPVPGVPDDHVAATPMSP